MVPRATEARTATSRIWTASYPPSAARDSAALTTRSRRAAWLRASAVSGAGSTAMRRRLGSGVTELCHPGLEATGQVGHVGHEIGAGQDAHVDVAEVGQHR